jgi:gamma-glutamyl:cysteine ligase YbdK (ATP-grasp superfamily)
VGGGRHKRTRIRTDRVGRTIAAMEEKDQLLAIREALLPELRADLASGLTAEQIYQKYQTLAAARSVQIVATEVDSSKALAAVKDILDRSQGKAKERQEIEHRLGKLPETELDALLLTKLKRIEDAEEAGNGEG